LIHDPAVPAIFEAAIECDDLRVRVDVLERLDDGSFGLREVKASGSVKEEHLDDVVIQLFALRGAGLAISSVEVIHLNSEFQRGDGPVDAQQLFQRRDVRRDVEFLLGDVPEQLAEMRRVLAAPEAPAIEPSPRCRRPHVCSFLPYCTAAKGEDWIGYLPGLRAAQHHALVERGVERILDIPADFRLNGRQDRARRAWLTGAEVVSRTLTDRLRDTGPPAAYLDFETFNPLIPLHSGMHPFEPVPFQWSLHRVDESGDSTHLEFLADGREDPRREFVETLLGALAGWKGPILVYSDFEQRVLASLARRFEDLAPSLAGLIDRLFDLLPVVRNTIYAPSLGGSFSIKTVAQALVPGFSYRDLEGIARGGDAAVALGELTRPDLPESERSALRERLLAYCARDTEALVVLHQGLLERARSLKDD
jgi:predicted RecB family nuclease